MNSAAAGVAYVLIVVGPMAAAAVRWRSWFLPGRAGAIARTAEAVLTFTALALVWHVLGAFGAFQRVPVLVASAVAGVAAWALAPRGAAPAPARTVDAYERSTLDVVVIAIVVALTVAQWAPGVIAALRAGPSEVDTLTFHLPMMSRFVRDGSLWDLHNITADFHFPFYPYDGDLPHAVGMLAFGSDLLTPFINLAWMGLVFVAAAAIGRRIRSEATAVAIAGIILVTFVMTRQAGAATTDVVGFFFFVAAIALLLHDTDDLRVIALAGLAAGAAIATKQSFVPPVAALTLVVVVDRIRAGGRRMWRAAGIWLGAMTVSGSFWYLRNLAHTGNPFPGLRLGPLPQPRMRLLEHTDQSIVDRLRAGELGSDFVTAWLQMTYGRLWPVLLVVAIAGCAVALWRGDRLWRGLGVVGLVVFAAYVVTPTTGGGPDSILFGPTLRYLVPGIFIGLCGAAAVVIARKAVASRWAAVAMVVLLVATPQSWNVGATGLVAAAVAAAGVAVLLRMRPLPRVVIVAGAAAAAACVLAASIPLEAAYLERRYTPDGAFDSAWEGGTEVAHAAQAITGARIGVVGMFDQYPLFGATGTANDVTYVGVEQDDGGFTEHTGCRSWREAVVSGGYDYIAVVPAFVGFRQPPIDRWVDDGATRLAGDGEMALYRIDGELDPERCPRP